MSDPRGPGLEVRRAADRFRTRGDGIESWHSFAFGSHHDPANTHHGLLVAHNEERLSAGAGFDAHPHREVEVITWVLSGTLVHEDSTGLRERVYPGLVQRMSAGSGIVHAERSDAGPVHFVQMWVVPDARGAAPGYESREIDEAALRDGLVPIATGQPGTPGPAAVPIGNAGAVLWAARLEAGQSVLIPDAPYIHLFVAVGAVRTDGPGRLETGDAVRTRAAGELRITAVTPAEVLVWQMQADAYG